MAAVNGIAASPIPAVDGPCRTSVRRSTRSHAAYDARAAWLHDGVRAPAPHAASGQRASSTTPTARRITPSPAILALARPRASSIWTNASCSSSFLSRGRSEGAKGRYLYQAFIDQKTRVVETGATGVWCWVLRCDQGEPAHVRVDNVAPTHADRKVTVRAIFEGRGVTARSDRRPPRRFEASSPRSGRRSSASSKRGSDRQSFSPRPRVRGPRDER